MKTVAEGKNRTTYMLRVGTAEYGAAQFYQLDEPSKAVWDLVDGTRTVGEIINEATNSGSVPKEDDVYGTLLFFAESGALKSKQDLVPWKRVRAATSFMTQIVLVKDSTKLLSYIHKVIRPALRSAALWASTAVALAGAIIYAPRFNSIFSDPRNFQIFGSSVVGYLFYNFVILAPVIVIHELAHAIALLHYSGRSGEIGTGWFYFGPVFYADVTAYWVLPRRQRLVIMWAGNLTTILIGSILVLSQLVLPLASSVEKTFDVAAFWCFYGTLWNLAPPFETDGYYILADLLKMPNLRQEGFGYLKSTVLRVFGRHSPEPEGLTRRKKVTLLSYSIGSIAALGYIGFRSLTFVAYMGVDAGSWGGRILGLGPGFTPVAIVVGATSIGYFVLMMGGYGSLIANQVKKSRVLGLKFEAVHDRNLTVFFYLPEKVSQKAQERFERKVAKLARHVTPGFLRGRKGPLLYITLQIGGGTLPLSQVKSHLRKTEDKFYKAYQRFLDHDTEEAFAPIPLSRENGQDVRRVLSEMANNVLAGDRRDAKQALTESIRRHELGVRLALNSCFASAWSIETPPAQQYDILQQFVPRVLIEDLTMTNLPGETEEFKRKTVYGLDTIAELATASSDLRDRVLAHPEKFEIVSLFEPVRGRITFVGKTERIEESLSKLGVLFIIHVWSGYVDNLLADANLDLYAIAQCLPSIPEDLTGLGDGELVSLSRYVSALVPLERDVQDLVDSVHETVHPSLQQLRDLKMLFEAKGGQRIGEFDAVLSLNLENIKSIPVRLKDTTNMSKTILEWLKALMGSIDSQHESRKEARLNQKGRLIRNYGIVLILSLVLLGVGLTEPITGIGLGLLTGSLLLQAAYGVAIYMFRRSSRKVPRYPSALFAQLLAPIYAVAQAVNALVAGMSVLNLTDILKDNKKQGRKKEGA